MARLRKVEVEALLAGYDADPVGALTEALRLVVGEPGWSWEQLVAALPRERRAGLLARDEAALDRLAVDLNEQRTVSGLQGGP